MFNYCLTPAMGGKYGNIGDTVMDVLRTVHTVVLSEKIGASTTPTNSTAPIILARRLSLKGLNLRIAYLHFRQNVTLA